MTIWKTSLLDLHAVPVLQIRWSIHDYVFAAGQPIDHVSLATLAEDLHFPCNRAAAEDNHDNPLASAVVHCTAWHDGAGRNCLRRLPALLVREKAHVGVLFGTEVVIWIENFYFHLHLCLLTIRHRSDFVDLALVLAIGIGIRREHRFLRRPQFRKIVLADVELDLQIGQICQRDHRAARAAAIGGGGELCGYEFAFFCGSFQDRSRYGSANLSGIELRFSISQLSLSLLQRAAGTGDLFLAWTYFGQAGCFLKRLHVLERGIVFHLRVVELLLRKN